MKVEDLGDGQTRLTSNKGNTLVIASALLAECGGDAVAAWRKGWDIDHEAACYLEDLQWANGEGRCAADEEMAVLQQREQDRRRNRAHETAFRDIFTTQADALSTTELHCKLTAKQFESILKAARLGRSYRNIGDPFFGPALGRKVAAKRAQRAKPLPTPKLADRLRLYKLRLDQQREAKELPLRKALKAYGDVLAMSYPLNAYKIKGVGHAPRIVSCLEWDLPSVEVAVSKRGKRREFTARAIYDDFLLQMRGAGYDPENRRVISTRLARRALVTFRLTGQPLDADTARAAGARAINNWRRRIRKNNL